jgi:hypothetical protein
MSEDSRVAGAAAPTVSQEQLEKAEAYVEAEDDADQIPVGDRVADRTCVRGQHAVRGCF